VKITLSYTADFCHPARNDDIQVRSRRSGYARFRGAHRIGSGDSDADVP
jgi:hypothetical protein